MIRLAAASMGAGLTGGLYAATVDAAKGDTISRPHRRLRAAFTNIGLQVTWCAQGKQATEFWGKLFNVDVTWFDGGLSAAQQAAALEEIASRNWDFVAIQPVEIDTLAAPVNRIIDAGIPVIDMDTLIAPLDQIGVHTFLAPDNEFMGGAVTKALVDAIGGAATIIMTQGALGHTGAQGRARGFESVIAQHPNVEVLATDAADWDPAKVVELWESYLDTYPHISAAFFHNDDMALAALDVRERGIARRPSLAASTPCRQRSRPYWMAPCSRPCATLRAAFTGARSSPAWRRRSRRRTRRPRRQSRSSSTDRLSRRQMHPVCYGWRNTF
jgi:ribose transport system substrate-binding protein